MPSKLSLVLVLAIAACGSQVDSEHQGDALVEIEGLVRNNRTLPIAGDGAEVAILWENTSVSPDIGVAETAQVTGAFPAAFSLAIYTAPADAYLNNWQGVKLGVAYIAAAVAGTNYDDENDFETGVLGLDENHLLVYVPQNVPPDSGVAAVLRSTPAAGFHLYGVYRLTDAEKEARQTCIESLREDATVQQLYSQCGGESVFDDFVPLPADLKTPLEIDIVDDISQINAPNWT